MFFVSLLTVALVAALDDPPAKKRTVAVFVHNGVELLDFAGPGEVFAAADKGKAFQVVTVAASKEPITSQRFLKVVPQYDLTDCPKPDVLVLPGGATVIPLGNEAVMAWVKKTAPETEVTLSVCTGAFLLARAGLLDGKEATTHWASVERLKLDFPKVTVKADRRWVDNGKLVTSAGVSAGIDASLHVVGRLLGEPEARKTARYMEHPWRPDPAGRE